MVFYVKFLMGMVPRFGMVGTVVFTWLWVGLLVGLVEDLLIQSQ
jgi:hypothetical protein